MRIFLNAYLIVVIILAIVNLIFGNIEFAVAWAGVGIAIAAYIRTEDLQNTINDLKKKLDM